MIDINLCNKYKLVCLLSCFLKDNYFHKSYFHSDLHDSGAGKYYLIRTFIIVIMIMVILVKIKKNIKII